MNESDFLKLPAETRQFVFRLVDLGIDRTRIYGLFVMLGIYVGAPNTQETQEEIDAFFSSSQLHLLIDRTKNIDEEIGHLYDGYDRQLNEFCFRSGIEFNFRKMTVPKDEESFYIVYLKDEGLLNKNIKSVERLADATKLFDSFIFSLGQSSVKRGASLIEAFCCGIFQIQLHSQSDIQGSRQIAMAIRGLMSPFFSMCFNTLISGKVDYFLELESGQIALLDLMQPMEQNYAQQMWGFQSSLFYSKGNLIDGIDRLDPRQWFEWVLNKAKDFDASYPVVLLPFSKSNVTLSGVPGWDKGITNFEICDAYIDSVWGYNSRSLNSNIESYEYKALLMHLVYSSLASSREVIH